MQLEEPLREGKDVQSAIVLGWQGGGGADVLAVSAYACVEVNVGMLGSLGAL